MTIKNNGLGLVGLGKMGGNMARRLLQAGIPVVGYNNTPGPAEELAAIEGFSATESLEALVNALPTPRTVWLMLPAGEITDTVIDQLADLLDPGDILVDGANSYYRDSMMAAERLAPKGIEFVDAGVSGGVWGLEKGYTLMIGASDEAFRHIQPVIETLAPAADRGWIHTGITGSGHFTKMIHNGIEYGMMQAYAEGFALLKGHKDFDLDVADIAETWRHGSVVRSWLLDLTADVLAGDTELDDIAPYVADSGEGRWTALEAIEQGVPTPVMSLALMARFASQGKQDYSARLLAMMRNQFGGHAVKRDS